jgi:hypothetical protein
LDGRLSGACWGPSSVEGKCGEQVRHLFTFSCDALMIAHKLKFI